MMVGESMGIKVSFYGIFREVFGKPVIEVNVKDPVNIGDLLEILCDSEERRKNIFNQQGEIKANVIVQRNGRHIDSFKGNLTILDEGDEIAILQMVCGG